MVDINFIKQNATASGDCDFQTHWYYFENTLYVEASAGYGDVYPLDLWTGNAFKIMKDIERAIFGEGCVLIDFSIFDTCRRVVQIDLPASFERACPHYSPEDCGPHNPWCLVEAGHDDWTPSLFASKALQRINVAEGNLNFASEDGVLFDKDKKTLICFPRGRTGTYTVPEYVQTIGEDAFDSCDRLDELIIPDSVTEIGCFAFHCVPHITYHGPAKSDNNWGAKSRN